MMAEAEIKAERLMFNAEERRLQLIEEVQEIKRQKIDFEVSLRGLLEKHIRMLDLNTVAIEQQDADARLLEEPLPFGEKKRPEVATATSGAAESAEPLVEEAEFDESEQAGRVEEPPTHYAGAVPPDLTFDFDPDDVGDEEDYLK